MSRDGQDPIAELAVDAVVFICSGIRAILVALAFCVAIPLMLVSIPAVLITHHVYKYWQFMSRKDLKTKRLKDLKT